MFSGNPDVDVVGLKEPTAAANAARFSAVSTPAGFLSTRTLSES